MEIVPHSASAALVEASEKLIERLRALIADDRNQERLALDLIRQAQDYIVLVEKIEASRIEGLASRDEGAGNHNPDRGWLDRAR
jgi:hypothetical protein